MTLMNHIGVLILLVISQLIIWLFHKKGKGEFKIDTPRAIILLFVIIEAIYWTLKIFFS